MADGMQDQSVFEIDDQHNAQEDRDQVGQQETQT